MVLSNWGRGDVGRRNARGKTPHLTPSTKKKTHVGD